MVTIRHQKNPFQIIAIDVSAKILKGILSAERLSRFSCIY